jgi:hypothetical protein
MSSSSPQIQKPVNSGLVNVGVDARRYPTACMELRIRLADITGRVRSLEEITGDTRATEPVVYRRYAAGATGFS